jgi:hypothetical protein
MIRKRSALPVLLIATAAWSYLHFHKQAVRAQAELSSVENQKAPPADDSRVIFPEAPVSMRISGKPNDDRARIAQARQTLQKELLKLRGCLATQNCAFSREDPRAYEFAVAHDAEKAVRQLKSETLRNKWRDAEITKGAVDALSWDEDNVRAAALDLLATQPPSAEARDGILQGVAESTDPSIYEQAMRELARYTDAGDQEKIDRFLQSTLQTGGFFAAGKVAEKIQPFLNAQNIPKYQKLVASLPEGSAKRSALEQALFEYSQR